MSKEEALDKALAELNNLAADYGDGFGCLSVHPIDKFYEVSYKDPADLQRYTSCYCWK